MPETLVCRPGLSFLSQHVLGAGGHRCNLHWLLPADLSCQGDLGLPILYICNGGGRGRVARMSNAKHPRHYCVSHIRKREIFLTRTPRNLCT